LLGARLYHRTRQDFKDLVVMRYGIYVTQIQRYSALWWYTRPMYTVMTRLSWWKRDVSSAPARKFHCRCYFSQCKANVCRWDFYLYFYNWLMLLNASNIIIKENKWFFFIACIVKKFYKFIKTNNRCENYIINIVNIKDYVILQNFYNFSRM